MAPRNEKRRNDILKVSFQLFSSEPYSKVSFSKIAAGAGIKKSLLQHYFPRKNDLIKTMLDEILKSEFGFMDTLSFEQTEADPFQKISDFNMLFFKSIQSNERMHQFITESVSQPEMLDEWIDSICEWLWGFLDHTRFQYLQIRTALVFSMGGSMHLFLHQDELGITYEYVCRTHIHAILAILKYPESAIETICDLTEERIRKVDASKFLDYCQKNIHWLEI